MNNQSPTHIRGIIFDLDGTLYKMKWFFKPLLTIMLFPKSLLLPRYMNVRRQYAGKDHDGGTPLLMALAEDLAGKKGDRNSQQMHDWIIRHFYTAFENVMPLLRGSRPGLNELLGRLRDNDIRLGVLSDFDRVAQRLNGLRIPPQLFDTLASTESSGCLKPSPTCFLSISSQWNIAPHSILVIGDRADTDGLGAQNAGMNFIQITDSPSDKKQALTWKQVKKLLDSILE